MTHVREPKHVYASTILRTQVGFHRHKIGKPFAIMVKVWNESHIVWELFPLFLLCKALHGIFSKHTEIPQAKIHDSLENRESKERFSQNTLKSILFDWNFF